MFFFFGNQSLSVPFIPEANRFVEIAREKISDQMRAFKLHEQMNKMSPADFSTCKEIFGLLAGNKLICVFFFQKP